MSGRASNSQARSWRSSKSSAELGLLARAVGLAVALEQRRDGRADLVLEPAPRLVLRLCEQSPTGPAASLLGADEREQLAIGRRAREQRLDARQAPQVRGRLRALVPRQLRARLQRRGVQRRQQLRGPAWAGGSLGAGAPAARRRASRLRISAREPSTPYSPSRSSTTDSPVAALARDRVAEGRLGQHQRLGLVQHAQLGRQPGLGGVLPQQARRERVNRPDLRARGVDTGRAARAPAAVPARAPPPRCR